MKAVILAGGMGTRLRPVTGDRPKPMVPLLGKPLMEHIIALLRAQGFTEICAAVHHRMGLENNPQTMRAKFAASVASERSPLLRVMPLFIKNLAMKVVFDTVGECKSCLCLSNLGVVRLPEVMVPYVSRMDFIIGVQAKAPHNCGVLTWNDTAYINCIRSIREPELELHFYQVLHRLGLHVTVESNQR